MDILFNKDADTICALSTASGPGALSILRVSGSDCRSAIAKLCPKQDLSNFTSHKAKLAYLVDSEGEKIDQVLLTYFQKGKSYTGEDTIEISCHGSEWIYNKILQELVIVGCRLAEKGEFTYRAFANGNIDLVQAESILQLINSKTHQQASLAIRSLEGELSSEFIKIKENLNGVLAQLEANIDYASEDIVIATNDKLLSELSLVESKVSNLSESYQLGKVIQNGIKVSIVGEPNVGKSSFLNALAKKDRSIVTDIAGTTRDIVEHHQIWDGQEFLFQDTAGLRETKDPIEKMGLEKTLKETKSSDVVVWVLDIQKDQYKFPIDSIEGFSTFQNWVLVLNKVDTIPEQNVLDLVNRIKAQVVFENDWLADRNFEVVPVSALESKGLERFKKSLFSSLPQIDDGDSGVVVSSRHFEELEKMKHFLSRGRELLEKDESPEFTVFELKEALLSVHRVLGLEFEDQIMDQVFKDFCLGK